MVFYFLVLLFFYLFNFDLFFFNEEFIIFISMLTTFYFCYLFSHNFVNMYLFFRIEFIYFFFLYLIILISNLVNKVFNLIYLKLLNFRSYVLANLFSLFIDSFVKINSLTLYFNSVLFCNLFNHIFSNVLIDYLYINSNVPMFRHFSFAGISFFYAFSHNYKAKLASFLYLIFISESFYIK